MRQKTHSYKYYMENAKKMHVICVSEKAWESLGWNDFDVICIKHQLTCVSFIRYLEWNHEIFDLIPFSFIFPLF